MIDLREYSISPLETGDTLQPTSQIRVSHSLPGCFACSPGVIQTIQDAVDWTLEHEERVHNAYGIQ